MHQDPLASIVSKVLKHAEIQATKEFRDARIAVKSLASISTIKEEPFTVTVEVALSDGIDSVSGRRAE
ncbi:MAG: hypothetical protein OEV85_03505 [Candidatus Thorarchaeota archaeon]|nr:hypothetical protein [Candidatus Thorarchaeota archaeon]